jgi:Flp pilus assembly protein CpaB
MNRARPSLIAIVALALGGLLGRGRPPSQATTAGTKTGVDVVIAANDIPVGAQIEGRDIKIVKFLAEDVPAVVFHGRNDVVGRSVVLPIAKGEFILPNKLSGKTPGPTDH